jgi:HEAT repeat protein
MPLIRKSPEAAPSPSMASPAGALRGGTPDERWAAARALAIPEGVGALAEALIAETDPRIREAILTSLARIGSPEAAAAVVPHIRSDDASVRTAALDALRAMPGAAATALPDLLADADADVRLLACELVRALPTPEATRLLCVLIERDAEANVCAAAIDVLAEAAGPDALPALALCADRFSDQPFLTFAAKIAAERIGSLDGGRIG